MAATAIASVVSSRFFGPSFFKTQFRRRGLDIDEGEARIALKRKTVAELMDEEFLIVQENATFNRVRALLARLTRGSLVVVNNDGTFAGIICPKDMSDDIADNELDHLVRAKDLLRSSNPYVFRTDGADQALTMMQEHGEDMLPVLQAFNNHAVIGVIHKSDLLMTYNQLLLDEKRHQQGD